MVWPAKWPREAHESDSVHHRESGLVSEPLRGRIGSRQLTSGSICVRWPGGAPLRGVCKMLASLFGMGHSVGSRSISGRFDARRAALAITGLTERGGFCGAGDFGAEARESVMMIPLGNESGVDELWGASF